MMMSLDMTGIALGVYDALLLVSRKTEEKRVSFLMARNIT